MPSGGSAYGLAAADGVMRWLAARNRGFRIGPEAHHVVPIVPAAVLFDLGVGGRFHNTPDATFGERAAGAARPAKLAQGTVGAGTGAHAERLKGGIGSASVVLPTGITVAALVALNSSGNVFDVAHRRVARDQPRPRRRVRPGVRRPSRKELAAHHANPPAIHPLNTTLAVIATDAVLAKHECTRMAVSGQDGLARAIDPVHQYVDGDVVFTLATGDRAGARRTDRGCDLVRVATRPFQLNTIFAAGADVVCRAVVHAAIAATTCRWDDELPRPFPSAVNS